MTAAEREALQQLAHDVADLVASDVGDDPSVPRAVDRLARFLEDDAAVDKGTLWLFECGEVQVIMEGDLPLALERWRAAFGYPTDSHPDRMTRIADPEGWIALGEDPSLAGAQARGTVTVPSPGVAMLFEGGSR